MVRYEVKIKFTTEVSSLCGKDEVVFFIDLPGDVGPDELESLIYQKCPSEIIQDYDAKKSEKIEVGDVVSMTINCYNGDILSILTEVEEVDTNKNILWVKLSDDIHNIIYDECDYKTRESYAYKDKLKFSLIDMTELSKKKTNKATVRLATNDEITCYKDRIKGIKLSKEICSLASDYLNGTYLLYDSHSNDELEEFLYQMKRFIGPDLLVF